MQTMKTNSSQSMDICTGFCPGFFERWAGGTCPFRCLQTVVVLTVGMDKLDCHVIK